MMAEINGGRWPADNVRGLSPAEAEEVMRPYF
jgi:hypothetical protein